MANKSNKKAWWASLTLDEQAEYVYNKMVEAGKQPNFDTIYNDLYLQGNFLR